MTRTSGGSVGEGELSGRSILVTGAGSGIGSAIAGACAAAGASLFLADRDEKVERVAERLSAAALTVDLAEDGAPQAVVDLAVKQMGSLDGVVHVAGIQIARGPLTELSDEDWQRILAIN